MIKRKTAVLIQGACRVGALVADASPEKEQALSAFGYNLGVAFQMADDLLDYTADSKELGKTVGADVREGKLTLPVIRALKNASGRTAPKWNGLSSTRIFPKPISRPSWKC